MSFSLLPKLQADALTELTPQILARRGIRLLMLDFDNTIVPYTTNEPAQKMMDWLKMMQTADIQICVVSNSHNQRVPEFCRRYGLDCITHAKKPFSKGIRACLEKYGLKPQQCALAGDQIYTDVLGANGAGVQSILVRAIDNHNVWLKLRHVAEMPFVLATKNRRIQK